VGKRFIVHFGCGFAALCSSVYFVASVLKGFAVGFQLWQFWQSVIQLLAAAPLQVHCHDNLRQIIPCLALPLVLLPTRRYPCERFDVYRGPN